MPDTTHLERYIAELADELARISEQHAAAVDLLNQAKGKSTRKPQKPKREPGRSKPVFERKYEKNAKTLILEGLLEIGGWTDTGKLREVHKAAGYQYNSATYDLTLKNLEKAGYCERRDAPKKGRFKIQWRITEKGRAEAGDSSNLRIS